MISIKSPVHAVVDCDAKTELLLENVPSDQGSA